MSLAVVAESALQVWERLSSHWIAEAIILGYNRKGLQPLEGLRTHSTRGIAISCVLFKGISVQDIYDAAFCAILHIFFQFY